MRVRNKGAAAKPKRRSNPRIQLVEIVRDGLVATRTTSQIRGYEPESGNAQRDCSLLEQLLLAHELVQAMCELDVVRDHPPVATRTRLLKPEPDLERLETARILRAVLEVVLHLLPLVVVELIVRRLESEGIAERLRVARQKTARLDRAVQPFVRIDRDGVGQSQSFEICARVVYSDCGRTVGAV